MSESWSPPLWGMQLLGVVVVVGAAVVGGGALVAVVGSEVGAGDAAGGELIALVPGWSPPDGAIPVIVVGGDVDEVDWVFDREAGAVVGLDALLDDPTVGVRRDVPDFVFEAVDVHAEITKAMTESTHNVRLIIDVPPPFTSAFLARHYGPKSRGVQGTRK